MPYDPYLDRELMLQGLTGVEPPDPMADVSGQFQANPFELFAENLHYQPTRAPQGFAEGLLGGLASGLASQGSRVAERRAKFQSDQSRRQAQVDLDRRTATQKFRDQRAQALRDISNQQRDERAKTAQYERDNPLVDERLIAAYPGLSSLPRMKGQRVEASMLQREAIQQPARDASAARQDAAASRAGAAAERAAAAAERQNTVAQANITGKLADDYRLDPAIKGYQQVRSNLNTAETAAKKRNGPGDIALIFSFMRALEPENPNAVREGEFDNARKAAGRLQQFQNLPDRFFKGTQLTDEGRQYFLDTMRGQLQSRRSDYDLANAQYRRRAESGGVEPSQFVRDFPSGSAASRIAPTFKPGGFFEKNKPGSRGGR